MHCYECHHTLNPQLRGKWQMCWYPKCSANLSNNERRQHIKYREQNRAEQRGEERRSIWAKWWTQTERENEREFQTMARNSIEIYIKNGYTTRERCTLVETWPVMGTHTHTHTRRGDSHINTPSETDYHLCRMGCLTWRALDCRSSAVQIKTNPLSINNATPPSFLRVIVLQSAQKHLIKHHNARHIPAALSG